jgi:hypothetical protein
MVELTATPATTSAAVAQEAFEITPRVMHLLVEGFREPTRGMALGSMEAGVREEGTRSMVVVLGASLGQWSIMRGW